MLTILTAGLAAHDEYAPDITNQTYYVIFQGKVEEVRFDYGGDVLKFPDGDETGATYQVGRWRQEGNAVRFSIDLKEFYGTIDALGNIRGSVVIRKEVFLFVAKEKGA